jgi:predicted RNA-binding protein
MNYWTDLFTPDTFDAFTRSDRTVSGFRITQRAFAHKVKPGDRLLCYLVRLSRWAGVLEVESDPFTDSTPIFHVEDDPFVLRFRVKPITWLPLEHTVPIQTPEIWEQLSFTRDIPDGGYWLGPLRRSLQSIDRADGELLESVLGRQAASPASFPVDAKQLARARSRRIQRIEKSVAVSVPEEDLADVVAEPVASPSDRQSFRIQASLCRLGEAMGLHLWLPAADRSRVLEHWAPRPGSLLDRLPLNYDETTLDTIERIDVLWLKGRTIRRAFEVEHSTAIYSGLLRMADLCALLPNINVRLHIVAPESRREKVFQEITRPVFSLLEHAPLSERCTYIPYSSVEELESLEHLSHTTDSVVDEFAEHAES